jgi:hypothetical protein
LFERHVLKHARVVDEDVQASELGFDSINELLDIGAFRNVRLNRARPAATTLAPCAANASAMSRPMRRAAPVTNATRPASFPVSS